MMIGDVVGTASGKHCAARVPESRSSNLEAWRGNRHLLGPVAERRVCAIAFNYLGSLVLDWMQINPFTF
jgi:hypothetical protein